MNKKKVFLKLPEYPGGKEEFKKYISENLKYPEQAIINQISGLVIIQAEIDDNGLVLNTKIIKSVGFGCDEEAERLIKNIHFGGVKNKGRRLKITKKFRINFILPAKQSIKYEVIQDKKIENASAPKTYSYTLNIQNKTK